MNKDIKVIEALEANAKNPFKMAEILKEASTRVKTRKQVRVDSTPEPDITNSGPIDSHTKEVSKLHEAWRLNPSVANYKRYQEAKKQK
jgi:hypothetical protein